MGSTEKSDFSGGGCLQKTNIEGGDYLKGGELGQFADLRGRGAWQEREGEK